MDRHEPVSLKQTCFLAARKHFAALDSGAITDLPVALIQELLPQLSVTQLEQLQPGLNHKGISTLSGWTRILKDVSAPNYPVEQLTEDEAKQEVMRRLFTHLFYGSTKPLVRKMAADLNRSSFLSTAAEYIQYFPVYPHFQQPLESLTSEHRDLLELLEKRIRTVDVTACADLLTSRTRSALMVLHRLLDHGAAHHLIVNKPSGAVLRWLLHRRGARCAAAATRGRGGRGPGHSGSGSGSGPEDEEPPPGKRRRLESDGRSVEPQLLCGRFLRGHAPSGGEEEGEEGAGEEEGACPHGRIERLELRQCGADSLRLLTSCLPSFSCLRSLTLRCTSALDSCSLSSLSVALQQLSAPGGSSLSHLSISQVESSLALEQLLEAAPSLTSLHLEILNVLRETHCQSHARTHTQDLPLQSLSVRVSELQTDPSFITLTLRRAPHLRSLHLSGLVLPPGVSLAPLFTALSESVRCLKSLNLEDVNLSTCLPEIQALLQHCRLEELRFADCRLLEKCSDKRASLRLLVGALRAVAPLRTLSLAQNRLAKNVIELSELFTGAGPSSLTHLDISSNYIQPSELLDLARRLRRQRRPPHSLTLDLSMNPGDRDPDSWGAALQLLRPLGRLLVNSWTSTDTMVDHVSIM